MLGFLSAWKEIAVIGKICGHDVRPFFGGFYCCERCRTIIHPEQVKHITRDRMIA